MKERPLIGAVGEHHLEEGKHAVQGRQQHDATITILDAGGRDDAVKKQTFGIDEDVALFALDQLARIKAVRINVCPPFSALLTLWLSMMQAVGLASRTSFSRHCTNSA